MAIRKTKDQPKVECLSTDLLAHHLMANFSSASLMCCSFLSCLYFTSQIGLPWLITLTQSNTVPAMVKTSWIFKTSKTFNLWETCSFLQAKLCSNPFCFSLWHVEVGLRIVLVWTVFWDNVKITSSTASSYIAIYIYFNERKWDVMNRYGEYLNWRIRKCA